MVAAKVAEGTNPASIHFECASMMMRHILPYIGPAQSICSLDQGQVWAEMEELQEVHECSNSEEAVH